MMVVMRRDSDGFGVAAAAAALFVVTLLTTCNVPTTAFYVTPVRRTQLELSIECQPTAFLTSAVAGGRSGSPLLFVSHGNHHYDDDIARLQGEFRSLQDALLERLKGPAPHDEDDLVAAANVAERMLDLAADAVALQRYKKVQAADDAQVRQRRARESRETAAARKGQAHRAAESAEREAALVESVDAPYEDEERVREFSKAHAAHQWEFTAREGELEGAFEELEAEASGDEALEAIAELRNYELRLRESVQQVRQLQCEKALQEWKEQEQHKYDAILDRIKWKFNL